MKQTIQHPAYGEIIYEESFWTGKRTLIIGGVPAEKRTKTEYVFGEDKTLVVIKGNYLYGISLVIQGETVEISPKPLWYEWILAIIPVFFGLVWGNSPVLCAIFPMIGGALGGGLGALSSMIALLYMKNTKKPLHKVLIALGVAAIFILIGYFMATAFILMLSSQQQ